MAQSTASPAANTPATQPQSAQNPPATLRTLPHATPGEAATQGQSSAGAPSVASAPGAAGSQEGEYSIRTSVNEVDLIFAVVDKHGHFVNNLTENDFALLDNRMPPEEVYSFKQQTNLPLRVGLLIDASNSIRSRFQFEQEAATEFLLDILRPQVDKAFVMGFDVVPDVTQGFTNNGDLLATGIHKLEPGGGTALYDAVYTACRDKLLPMHGTTALRKAIILVSDGDDNQSHTDLDDAIKMCQRADTIIYAVSTNNSPSRDRGDDVLKAMAEATGGRAIYPIDMEHVADAFRAIQDELRSQYSLVYKPADFKANDSFRPIYLVTMDRRYKVRVSKGYFAQK
ncbi:MAG TPA: VWA domain-containing protein [Acidobacteriaceae bacterium]|nr:VWA domain-containing protein [Acidobacteriaceae bacterium]